jgi:hypothetical protein
VARRWMILVSAIVLSACSSPAASSLASPTGSGGSVAQTSGSSPAVVTPQPTVAGSLDSPAGVIVMGHSGVTGEGTAGNQQAAPENSWPTGTNPDVNSLYLRLKSARPELAGSTSNQGQGAAASSSLGLQTAAALREVPYPALAIIATIDQDIRCDGTDPSHLPDFGAAVRGALSVIAKASPKTKILIVGQAGRPDAGFLQELVARDPSVKATVTGTGMCDFYGPDGTIQPAHIATLSSIIDAYEQEEAKVCSEFPQCVTDGGVRAAYKDKLENFSPDWNHQNVRGQAAQAELLWPVVKKLLGI